MVLAFRHMDGPALTYIKTSVASNRHAPRPGRGIDFPGPVPRNLRWIRIRLELRGLLSVDEDDGLTDAKAAIHLAGHLRMGVVDDPDFSRSPPGVLPSVIPDA